MKGWAELCLLLAVCAACWTRTPVGALAHAGLAWSRGEATPDLLASFRTELPRALQRSFDRAMVAGPLPLAAPAPTGGWTPALRTAVSAHLGEAALVEIEALARQDGGLEPEAALERWALGEAAVQRAIARARASGEGDPQRLDSHRRFLSDEAAAAADRSVAQTLSLATVLDLSWPVDPSSRVTSGFGYRVHPTLKTRKLHEGVDIAVPVGTPVLAAGQGRVTSSKQNAVSGRFVVLDHGHGVTTAYCHGDALRVDAGTRVDRGHLVMHSGNSGRSTGPHLHFGLRIQGRPVDPQGLLRAPGPVSQGRPAG